MTETQRKWLTEYLGEKWLELTPTYDEFRRNRTFTSWQDKQDLLEKVIENGEWDGFLDHLWDRVDGGHFTAWLIKLSPEKTAELICRWKGVE